MNKLMFLTYVLCCGLTINVHAQAENTPATKVLDLLKGYVIIQGKVNQPLELPGSILMVENEGKSDQREYFVKLNPVAENAKSIPKNDILYESIIDRGFAAKLEVLSFASAQMAAEDKAHVIVEDVYSASGPQYSAIGVKEKAMAMAKDGLLSRPNAKFYYVQSVLYTSIKHKIFNKKSFASNFTGYGIGVKGDVYTTTSLFTMTPVVSVNVWPIATPSLPTPPVKPTLNEIKNFSQQSSM